MEFNINNFTASACCEMTNTRENQSAEKIEYNICKEIFNFISTTNTNNHKYTYEAEVAYTNKETLDLVVKKLQARHFKVAVKNSVQGDSKKILVIEWINPQPQQEQQNNKEDDVRICGICMDKEKEYALQCGHLVCENCVPSSGEACPYCRKEYNRRIKIYF